MEFNVPPTQKCIWRRGPKSQEVGEREPIGRSTDVTRMVAALTKVGSDMDRFYVSQIALGKVTTTVTTDHKCVQRKVSRFGPRSVRLPT